MARDPRKGVRRKARLVGFEIFGVQGFVVGPALAPGIPSNPRGLFPSCVQSGLTAGLPRPAWFVPGPVTPGRGAGETAYFFADQVPELFGLQNEAAGRFGIGLPPQTVHYERESGGRIGTAIFFGKAILAPT